MSYHMSLGSEPTRVFHGGILYNLLDQILRFKFEPNFIVTTDFADELLKQTQILYYKTEKMSCSHLSNAKVILTKKQEFRHSKRKTIVTFYNLKRTTRDQKFHSETSDGSVRM